MEKINKFTDKFGILIIIGFFLFLIVGFGYEIYDEETPHFGCKDLVEIPIQFEDYAVDNICSGTYINKVGPYDCLRVIIIGDNLKSDMRVGNSGKIIIHKGKIHKWGFAPHAVIEFNGEIFRPEFGSITIFGYKNNNSEKLCLEEIIGYLYEGKI